MYWSALKRLIAKGLILDCIGTRDNNDKVWCWPLKAQGQSAYLQWSGHWTPLKGKLQKWKGEFIGFWGEKLKQLLKFYWTEVNWCLTKLHRVFFLVVMSTAAQKNTKALELKKKDDVLLPSQHIYLQNLLDKYYHTWGVPVARDGQWSMSTQLIAAWHFTGMAMEIGMGMGTVHRMLCLWACVVPLCPSPICSNKTCLQMTLMY